MNKFKWTLIGQVALYCALLSACGKGNSGVVAEVEIGEPDLVLNVVDDVTPTQLSVDASNSSAATPTDN